MFDMFQCNPMAIPMDTHLKLLADVSLKLVDVTLYRQIIGSLMYLTNTMPDICFVVNTLSQYIVEPRHVHLVVVKNVMRYLKGIIDYGLRDPDFRLYGYIDAVQAGSTSDMKKTSGGCYCLGSTTISWFSKKISSVSLITVEQSK